MHACPCILTITLCVCGVCVCVYVCVFISLGLNSAQSKVKYSKPSGKMIFIVNLDNTVQPSIVTQLHSCVAMPVGK